jgi:hypothetical protein
LGGKGGGLAIAEVELLEAVEQVGAEALAACDADIGSCGYASPGEAGAYGLLYDLGGGAIGQTQTNEARQQDIEPEVEAFHGKYRE